MLPHPSQRLRWGDLVPWSTRYPLAGATATYVLVVTAAVAVGAAVPDARGAAEAAVFVASVGALSFSVAFAWERRRMGRRNAVIAAMRIFCSGLMSSRNRLRVTELHVYTDRVAGRSTETAAPLGRLPDVGPDSMMRGEFNGDAA